MKFIALRPIIYTDKLDESIELYTQQLGFTCAEKNDDWSWASLYRNDVEIMFAKPNAHKPFERSMFTGSFYINVDNVDELWKELKDKTKVCYEPENFEWGMREFAVYDNNGILLQFGQDITQ